MKFYKKIAFLSVFLSIFTPLFVQAQILEPVQWSIGNIAEKDTVIEVNLKATINKGWQIHGVVEYMACNDEMCIPPQTWEFEELPKSSGNSEKSESTEKSDNSDNSDNSTSLWWILLMGFLGGLLAIFTPCVWPIIPMTVSFFMKKEAKTAKRNALLYGLSIVLIYVGLGLVITLLFGASALNDLSTNAVLNIFFFLLLVLFAFSFFGAFDITLPSSWSTHLDSKAKSTSGILSIWLMAFTLVIVSFSCTGPIIGTLLVEAAGKSLLSPTIGMLGFSIALALPFSLFAMFPQWIKRLPKSGNWMDSFKIVLAFLELALSLKFFSVADLAYGWHLLDREVFLALWIAIFALLGIYLLGIFRFKHEQPTEGIGVFRFMLAVCSLSFSIYMIPGLWGAPLKAISAFAPPMNTQDFVIQQNSSSTQTFNYLEDNSTELPQEIFEQAKRENKEIILDFSGYGCVNCRKMEAKVLSDSRVETELKKYIVVILMVDDKHRLTEPITVTENGKEKSLKTVGDKWSYLQRTRFGANAQPYFVRLSTDGKQIGAAYSYNEDIQKFLNWLR